jgi:hypothetical protein
MPAVQETGESSAFYPPCYVFIASYTLASGKRACVNGSDIGDNGPVRGRWPLTIGDYRMLCRVRYRAYWSDHRATRGAEQGKASNAVRLAAACCESSHVHKTWQCEIRRRAEEHVRQHATRYCAGKSSQSFTASWMHTCKEYGS